MKNFSHKNFNKSEKHHGVRGHRNFIHTNANGVHRYLILLKVTIIIIAYGFNLLILFTLLVVFLTFIIVFLEK